MADQIEYPEGYISDDQELVEELEPAKEQEEEDKEEDEEEEVEGDYDCFGESC